MTHHLTVSPNFLAAIKNTVIDGLSMMDANGTKFLQLSSIVLLTGDMQNNISNMISKDISVKNKV